MSEVKNTVNHWVHDYETLSNLFVACFIHYKTDETKVFVIHRLRNDLHELLEFLDQNKKNGEWHISYNGLSFDSQITEYILRGRKFLVTWDPEDVAEYLYGKAQDIIQRQEDKQRSQFAEWQLQIGQIDIFKTNHWDNAAKRSSLKWLEFSMDWPNVQEMPIHHSSVVTTMDEINIVIGYCINDVRATKKLMQLSKPLIEVRTRIKNKYGLKCYSYSNTKLGSELLLKLYCESTGNDPREVRQMRTRREKVVIKDILFPYISFKTIDLIGFHEMLKGKVIHNTKKEFEYKLRFMGYDFYYGAGGVHQCIDRGIYKADEEWVIMDLDVASLYPSIACVNRMYPAHLGEDFFRVYKEGIVDVRLAEKAKKENRDMAIIEGFKEAANASYGNSNSEYSWLYDPQYTMQTTINGQLLITMLVENLLISLTGAQLLQTNTDGATLRIRRDELDKYKEICKEWEGITKLTLEFAEYSAMYIWDVNNYIGVYADHKKSPKCKGRFEWEDLQKHKHTHLHKNKSHLIVAKALFNYFVNDIPPERYLMENRNIYDYCAGAKAKSDWCFQQVCVVDQKIVHQDLQDTLRYYVSTKGCKIIKKNRTDNREIQLESGKWLQQEFNVYKELPWEEYNVDESYYLEQIYKEIHNIMPRRDSQTKLEF